jgi:hypothetical protein
MKMNTWAVMSVVICTVILAARYMQTSKKPQQRTARRRLTTARILIAAALALAAIGYRLQRQARSLDGQGDYEPSLLERILLTLSR